MMRGLLLLLLALPLLSSCGTPPLPDVLLVTIDTLRPDHMGLFGYERATTPKVDDWFGPGIAAVFERSYSTEASTSPSVISLLTGRYPQEHRVRLLYQLVPDSCALLPAFLPAEYQTAAVVSNNVLTDEAMGIADRFDFYDDFVDQVEPYRPVYERNAARTTDAALRWLAELRDPDRPVFLWVHYIDPHGPYHPPDDWQTSFTHEGSQEVDLDRVQRYQQEPGLTDGLAYVDRYDEEIAYTDAHVGRLLEGFDRAVGADDALLVYTADHGESMMEHERWFTHGYHVYDEIVRVPLMIRGPGVRAGRRQDLVSGIDVVPTILGATGAVLPSGVRGVDLRRRDAVDLQRTIFTEATPGKGGMWKALVRGERKWMVLVRKSSENVVGRRSYDLREDPLELRSRAWRAEDLALTDELLRWLAADPDPAGVPRHASEGLQLDAPKVDPRISPEARERLKALGYVE